MDLDDLSSETYADIRPNHPTPSLQTEMRIRTLCLS